VRRAIDRPEAAVAAVLGGALFLGCCAVVRGGLFDQAPYGDVHLYAHYSRLMLDGRWPYRDFFDEYPQIGRAHV